MNYNQQQYLNDYLVDSTVLSDPNTFKQNNMSGGTITTNNNSTQSINTTTTNNNHDTTSNNSNSNNTQLENNPTIINASSSNISPTDNGNTNLPDQIGMVSQEQLSNGLPISINTANASYPQPTSNTAGTAVSAAPVARTRTGIINGNQQTTKVPMNLQMNQMSDNNNNLTTMPNGVGRSGSIGTVQNNISNDLSDNGRLPPNGIPQTSNQTYANDGNGMETNDMSYQNANANNRQYYLMNMANNPHLMNDASIQETLSPYFQPFGVDVAHLPMTNPPIFQSSLPVYDEPVPRRRISISNGQISQLGEDIETVENLYNTQPPPLPKYHDPNHTYQSVNKQMVSQGAAAAQQPSNGAYHIPPQQSQQVMPSNGIRQKQGSITGMTYVNGGMAPNEPGMRPSYQERLSQQQQQQPVLQPSIRKSLNQQMNPVYVQQMNYRTDTNVNPQLKQQLQENAIPSTAPGHLEHRNSLPQSELKFPDPRVKQEYLDGSESSSIPPQQELPKYNSYGVYERSGEATPGTTAWKRARLLERNRIAASKCRQRKKVAQLQLQIDYDKISKENVILRKKLVYYEKLISKFKKFTESHFNTCHKTSSSVNDDDKNALKIIQEMLMIDEDIHEVNDNGKIIKLSVKDLSPSVPITPSQLGDSDIISDGEID
ncbi:similar to Saccharomyces cerevisiae YIL036W CST6 Basic leucine zipper (bZIP) transcription factor of the ATF/CREB family, proposed to be a regulator of oleate responsive genes [Maudiozyma barnettii]|uniref:Similar to Saccharomyces cerevisiae YIL036W CST6 Basic leucine zipper (BZIP) transcription factor of the ATF/CREB family, proposed to be a regulator of oleate responsive genes n=1 Tax=Maudiozyma barnettii TaxID=61262 RepID=A0A8H2VHX8_9SACH|nr:Cst6p [Kazachstania barnettii]CAB4255735.1 similar to Saccharomyces cerevisiae YIL036W CST6 Basic leucine zipper (bZIP) transcription factor of the ATF/CREB family, proposed to be a regulator of oleate responsive genes [Kazachstania barnettii]CAD1784296.1 similar to Saccharomyces cerevisiae YIL036W CST6 Basic leucine zipper (bZIP) transcription factor of the ATF/CREB family, proposed to be a regulator of oleate responsive genes [Kazachstania barnettii]